MHKNDFDVRKVQGAGLHVVEPAQPTRELTIPLQREILYRFDYSPQMPAEIARGLRLRRETVDLVIKASRSMRGPLLPPLAAIRRAA